MKPEIARVGVREGGRAIEGGHPSITIAVTFENTNVALGLSFQTGG